MEQRLSMVTLGVKDLARSRQFYEQGMGLVATAHAGEEIVFYPMAGMVLALYPLKALAEDMNLESAPTIQPGGVSLAYNTRSKEEVDQVLSQAVKAGAELRKAAQEVFWGGYSGYFLDPDGHAWEVAWNPFWTITSEGHVLMSTEQDVE